MKVNKPKKPIKWPQVRRVHATSASHHFIEVKPMKSPIPLDEYLKKLGLLE